MGHVLYNQPIPLNSLDTFIMLGLILPSPAMVAGGGRIKKMFGGFPCYYVKRAAREKAT